ncbi:diguanylate cyclase (GGDEF)-like protein [Micromonospora sp. Llam0]|uniref:GGDEF domain-containing protein n=1 Tax=Micromonospora sp. Llam0 TaxID=2485143 RepID=UPI000FC3A698|nr:GGDEF domain-containing protein [Micromonospora sp. Llam0]ROO52765.1 diguanylate cyclase (GGDEF)-like protein [Micromonospora sp. Llam0]
MSLTSYLRAAVRRPSLLATGLAQAAVLALIFTARPYAAAFAGLFGIAWLAFLIAMADVRMIRARTQRDTATGRIAELEAEVVEANTDPVTGLPVRRVAEQHLAARAGVELTVAVVDVDGMHDINNSHDHQFGDAYLAGVADRLLAVTIDGDVAARLGGDEFVLISARAPQQLADALAAAVREPVTIDGTPVPLRLSIGICRATGGDVRGGLGRADRAMYTAKRHRSGIAHYDPDRDGVPQQPGVRPAIRHRDRRTARPTTDNS